MDLDLESDEAIATLDLLKKNGRYNSETKLFLDLNYRLKQDRKDSIGKSPTFRNLVAEFEKRGFIRVSRKRRISIEITRPGLEYLDYMISKLRPQTKRFGFRPRSVLLEDDKLEAVNYSEVRVTMEGGARIGHYKMGTFVKELDSSGTPVVIKPYPSEDSRLGTWRFCHGV